MKDYLVKLSISPNLLGGNFGNKFMTIQEISDLRKTQGNWHITNLPIYIVQRKKRTYGFSLDYASEFVWIENGEEVTDDELIIKLNEADEDWVKWDNLEESHKYSKCYYKEEWEFVTLFFTEKSAREYVATKGYRHGELRLWVDSAYNNWELKAVIEMLEGK